MDIASSAGSLYGWWVRLQQKIAIHFILQQQQQQRAPLSAGSHRQHLKPLSRWGPQASSSGLQNNNQPLSGSGSGLGQDSAQPLNSFYTRFPRGERRQTQEALSSGTKACSRDGHNLSRQGGERRRGYRKLEMVNERKGGRG